MKMKTEDKACLYFWGITVFLVLLIFLVILPISKSVAKNVISDSDFLRGSYYTTKMVCFDGQVVTLRGGTKLEDPCLNLLMYSEPYKKGNRIISTY